MGCKKKANTLSTIHANSGATVQLDIGNHCHCTLWTHLYRSHCRRIPLRAREESIDVHQSMQTLTNKTMISILVLFRGESSVCRGLCASLGTVVVILVVAASAFCSLRTPHHYRLTVHHILLNTCNARKMYSVPLYLRNSFFSVPETGLGFFSAPAGRASDDAVWVQDPRNGLFLHKKHWGLLPAHIARQYVLMLCLPKDSYTNTL